MGTSHDQYAFWIISFTFILRMRNVADIICRKTQNTYFMYGNFVSKIVPLMR